ncbi:metal-dependent hydrolase family protein [Aliiglaciecola lipolytica]|uniref:Xaa-Pro dipeptidase family enzyme n=1 Tax=Aliiglaciecola lipolytica E3 TaxID=1127673 RepID=K6XX91_9ALTE|nr:amidohydrolase family protein [Aliiglaciecola lipolytica]GAC16261.1 Xaa-Pro dipeptidase family enzyme [Aliiglaciecola lipolytica E3]
MLRCASVLLKATTLVITSACLNVGHAATIIHAGTLISAESDDVRNEVSVIIEGNKISRIEKGFVAASSDDEVIDLSEYTLMPGLMDMHTHISSQHSGPSSYLEGFVLNEADYAIKGVVYAEKTLNAGFTTVRNLGDGYNETVALRNAINRGQIPGPRLFTAAKSIATTGGHADPTNSHAKIIHRDPGPLRGVINGETEARQAVRQRYKDGADLIKITATGGVLSVAKSGQNPQFMEDELQAIVATAKDYGMTVAVHAHGKEGMRRAILAGVTSIEHGTYMDKEIFKLMKKHGTYYVPTIMAGNWVAEKAKIDGFFPELVRPKAAEIGPLIKQTFADAYKAGVNIAFGTDSGVSAHGDNGLEFVLMVEAGMKPMEAIRSATYHGAKLLNELDRLGTIEAGKLADMVAVKGNPLDDITEMQDIDFVMKDGKVFIHK